jgi:hypothetical protein
MTGDHDDEAIEPLCLRLEPPTAWWVKWAVHALFVTPVPRSRRSWFVCPGRFLTARAQHADLAHAIREGRHRWGKDQGLGNGPQALGPHPNRQPRSESLWA